MLNHLSELSSSLQTAATRKRVAVVCPNDSHTVYVIERALREGVADFTLCLSAAPNAEVERIVGEHPDHVVLQRADTPDEAAQLGVAIVRSGEADALMKGTINTDNLLRAVLDKRHGLLREGCVLSHVAVAEMPSYPKLLTFSDAAVIPHPTLEQFEAILGYVADTCRRIGATKPNIALIHCTEKTSDKFPHTISYKELKRRAEEGRYGLLTVDGPMDVKTACDAESGAIKGICSPIAGKADGLIFPNIEAGNTFYKALSCFANGKAAGVLRGTTAPVVVASRADSEEAKYDSLALSLML